jgi:hypothetical protein
MKYWIALISFTISSLLQLTFNVCLDKHLILLDSSLKFAVVGGPFGLIALLLAITKSMKAEGSKELTVGASLGLVMWYIFVTLH